MVIGLPLCGLGVFLIFWGLNHIVFAFALAPFDRRSENVRVLPVIITEQ
jgi:hypothetical protein